MKLEEVKTNAEIMRQLRWDLTPQNANISGFSISCQADLDRLNKLLEEKAGYYLYVDVWNCQAHLALMENRANGGGKSERITDFESPLLEKAVYQVGGSITTSGWYPLSKALATLLKRKLGVDAK